MICTYLKGLRAEISIIIFAFVTPCLPWSVWIQCYSTPLGRRQQLFHSRGEGCLPQNLKSRIVGIALTSFLNISKNPPSISIPITMVLTHIPLPWTPKRGFSSVLSEQTNGNGEHKTRAVGSQTICTHLADSSPSSAQTSVGCLGYSSKADGQACSFPPRMPSLWQCCVTRTPTAPCSVLFSLSDQTQQFIKAISSCTWMKSLRHFWYKTALGQASSVVMWIQNLSQNLCVFLSFPRVSILGFHSIPSTMLSF